MSGDLCLENYILHWNFKSHKGAYVLEALWLHPLFQVLSRHLFTDLIPVFLIIKEVECLFIHTFSRTSLDPTFLTEFPGGVSLEQRLRWWWTLIISRLLIVTIFPSLLGTFLVCSHLSQCILLIVCHLLSKMSWFGWKIIRLSITWNIHQNATAAILLQNFSQ